MGSPGRAGSALNAIRSTQAICTSLSRATIRWQIHANIRKRIKRKPVKANTCKLFSLSPPNLKANLKTSADTHLEDMASTWSEWQPKYLQSIFGRIKKHLGAEEQIRIWWFSYCIPANKSNQYQLVRFPNPNYIQVSWRICAGCAPCAPSVQCAAGAECAPCAGSSSTPKTFCESALRLSYFLH